MEFRLAHGFDLYTFACASVDEQICKYVNCANLQAEMVRESHDTHGISSSLILRDQLGIYAPEVFKTS